MGLSNFIRAGAGVTGTNEVFLLPTVIVSHEAAPKGMGVFSMNIVWLKFHMGVSVAPRGIATLMQEQEDHFRAFLDEVLTKAEPMEPAPDANAAQKDTVH